MEDQTLVCVRGLPGAGKSTWARAWVAEDPSSRVRVNRDDLRVMTFGSKGGTLSPAQELHITHLVEDLVRRSLRKGFNVVVDATNLRPRYIKEFISIAEDEGCPDIQEVFFPIDVEEACRRQDLRPSEDRVPPEVIRGMAQKFLPRGRFLEVEYQELPSVLDNLRPYVPLTELPETIICDLDGTLALMGDRGPYDYTRVHEDSVNEGVVKILQGARDRFNIIFCSGREDSCSDSTKEWILRNTDLFNSKDEITLFMRKTGDQRRDSVVKLEIFNEHIRDSYNVSLVLDDRDQVVQMWRELGLPCFQVAPGNF